MSRLLARRVAQLGAVSLGLAGVAKMAHYSRMKSNRQITAEDWNLTQLPTFDSIFRLSDVAPGFFPSSDKLTYADHQPLENNLTSSSSSSSPGTRLTLFAFHHCPFCSKVEVFLTANNIPYTKVYVNRLTKKELQGRLYQKVPQLTVEQTNVSSPVVLVDASSIISAIHSKLPNATTTPEQQASVQQWRDWSSAVLARFVVLEVNSSLLENARYLYNTKDLGLVQRILFGLGSPFLKMFIHPATTKRLLEQSEITQTMVDCPMQSLSSLLEKYVTAVAPSQPFHGGKKPDMADCEVYGVLYGIKLHPMYARIKRDASPRALQWIQDMERVATPQQ